MKARFLNQRSARTSWENQRVGEFHPHRPYTVAISVHAGEVVRFSLGIRPRVNHEETGDSADR